MSGAAYRPADQKLVFHVTEKVSPQQTSVTNTYIPHQSSVTSNHSNNSSRSTGSRRLLSTGSSKQDSVQDVETNLTVRFPRVFFLQMHHFWIHSNRNPFPPVNFYFQFHVNVHCIGR